MRTRMHIGKRHLPRQAGKTSISRQNSHGMTLLELMLALSITTMLGSAMCALIAGAMNTDRFLRSTNSAQSEIEVVVDHLSNNIREAQSGSIVVGTGTLSTLTQPDAANGYANGSTVSYSLATDPTN